MADQKKRRKPGRKPAEGIDKRKFLATLEAEVIKALKLAAIEKNTSASEILEDAAEQWLERWTNKVRKKSDDGDE